MRLIRLLVNWLFVLTSPIWVLPVLLLAIFLAAKDGTKYRRAWMTGENWIGEEK